MTKQIGYIGAILSMVLLFACPAFILHAYAADDNVQLDAPTTVSDDITRLHVSKLDADTHEYLAGATMAIVNEATGEVVDSWVTGTAVHENEKGLDVGVTYILREIEAPEGYGKVEDVRFVVNETEGSGITILSQGSDSELSESYKVSLYDAKKPVERETVVTSTSSNASSNTSSNSSSKVVAPKTGDETPLTTVLGLMGLGIAAIIALQIVKRSTRREE